MSSLSLPSINPENPPANNKRPVVSEDSFSWRRFRDDEFWRFVPAYEKISSAEFLDPLWQEKNAIINVERLKATLAGIVAEDFLNDMGQGLSKAPMSVRLSPYLVALIDWQNWQNDPLRRQFLPLASQLEVDHPLTRFDSTHEIADAPVPGITHRYFDRVLFLVTDICPVYCRFCTRSYAVGSDTPANSGKVSISVNKSRWEEGINYIAERHEIEDIVISGGDLYRLKPDQIREIANRLLDIPHVRRLRFATKGPAVQPMKILKDSEWVKAVVDMSNRARKMHKEAVMHTHFNHPSEITKITQDAMNLLYEQGVSVRNLSVMLRGVNDDADVQIRLNRQLTWMNIRPYYTYMCDMVQGIEDLRTPLSTGIEIEKAVRGAASGPYTPFFVVDPPGGCGKRNLHSFEHYNKETGLAVYTAPMVKAGQYFLYADPLRFLSPEIQAAWKDPVKAQKMVDEAIEAAK